VALDRSQPERECCIAHSAPKPSYRPRPSSTPRGSARLFWSRTGRGHLQAHDSSHQCSGDRHAKNNAQLRSPSFLRSCGGKRCC